MSELYDYILNEYPSAFTTHFATDMLDNILEESEKIEKISERCEWLEKMIPQIRLSEIRDILLR